MSDPLSRFLDWNAAFYRGETKDDPPEMYATLLIELPITKWSPSGLQCVVDYILDAGTRVRINAGTSSGKLYITDKLDRRFGFNTAVDVADLGDFSDEP